MSLASGSLEKMLVAIVEPGWRCGTGTECHGGTAILFAGDTMLLMVLPLVRWSIPSLRVSDTDAHRGSLVPIT